VYKKSDVFVANCVLFNLFALGKTEIEAVQNLKNSMNQALQEYNIFIKPIY
jgi:predicted RNase H-like HicB family nuclease